jgi:hypothetical protein
MAGMRATLLAVCLLSGASLAMAQVPQPFPKPGQQPPPSNPAQQTPAQPTPVTAQAPAPPLGSGEPAPGALGVTVYPAAQFITSYDAGKGQRYYLYGTMTPFAEIVQYYRNTLRTRGDQVFEQPPVHQFNLGRFREETMAFPPSVTVKDYTWNGSKGYLNPAPGAQPQRFPTIIQIVPNPPAVVR